MNKLSALTVTLVLIFSAFFCEKIPQSDLEQIKNQIVKKDDLFNGRFPEYTVDGKWKFRKSPNWFSGFLAGQLWLMYEMTGQDELKTRALRHADRLVQYAGLDNTHDMGFIFYPSCVVAFQKTGEEKYKGAALQAADMLARRFNSNGKFIRAWGKLGTENREGWSIIDTMMNLELLFWAAEQSGNRKLYNIAYQHALTSMNEHVRANGSSWHVIEFDPDSGKLLRKFTHQGFSDESTWARGQAWGIYGFANTFKRTRDERFLQTAQRMADYFLARLPDDLVPYWDLDLSGEEVLRDASAGAIAASGLFLLADLTREKSRAKKYLGSAKNITRSLLNDYLFTRSSRPVEEGILLHCIYNFNSGYAVDESYPAGDYYFIEALWKLWRLEDRKN